MKNSLKRNLALFAALLSGEAMAGSYQLIWYDEFDYKGLPDSSKWAYDNWEPRAVNEELQKYTASRLENTRVEGGVLKIEARRDGYDGYEYTSGRLTTKGKFEFTTGIVEIRAKLPWGRGSWPGIFMLSADDSYGAWPNSGEIDLMEHVGFNMDWVRSSIHCEDYNFKKFWELGLGEEKNADVYVQGVANDFHTYRLEWTHETIAISVDGKAPHFVFNNEHKGASSWPFDKNFYLILNQAVGGVWGGQQGIDTSIFPQLMLVDYVRVYQWRDSPVTSIYIEAEAFQESSGIKTEACSEGGLNVSSIDAGDWMKYEVTVPASGLYDVQYRIGSPKAGGQIALDQNGRTLAVVDVPVTDGLQKWQTITHRVNFTAGKQNLAIYSNKGGFNVNWLKLNKVD